MSNPFEIPFGDEQNFEEDEFEPVGDKQDAPEDGDESDED